MSVFMICLMMSPKFSRFNDIFISVSVYNKFWTVLIIAIRTTLFTET